MIGLFGGISPISLYHLARLAAAALLPRYFQARLLGWWRGGPAATQLNEAAPNLQSRLLARIYQAGPECPRLELL